MAQLGQRLAFDLADALARDAEFATDFLESARMAVLKAEAELDDLALTVGKTVEHLLKLLTEHGVGCRVRRCHGTGVLDEVAELGILFLADGRLERNRLLADLLDLAHAVG